MGSPGPRRPHGLARPLHATTSSLSRSGFHSLGRCCCGSTRMSIQMTSTAPCRTNRSRRIWSSTSAPLVFIGLMGAALYLLVRDMPGTAARISRLAIGPFVVLYAAWETVSGSRSGPWSSTATMRPSAQQPAVADTIQASGVVRSSGTPEWWVSSDRLRGPLPDRAACIPRCRRPGPAWLLLAMSRLWRHTRRRSARSVWCSLPRQWLCWRTANALQDQSRRRHLCAPQTPVAPCVAAPRLLAQPRAAPAWTVARRPCCGWRRRSPGSCGRSAMSRSFTPG